MAGCKILHFAHPCHSFYENTKNTHIEVTKDFDFGNALLSNYIVLKKFLSYLSYNELYNLSKVNDDWGTVVENFVRKRQDLIVFAFAEARCIKFNRIKIKPSLCILFQKYGGNVALTNYVCIHFDKTPSKRQLIQFLDGDLIPNKCPILKLTCRRMECSFTSDKSLYGLIYPSIDDVKVNMFRVPYGSREKISTIVSEEVQSDEDIVCLLVYGKVFLAKFIQTFISKIQQRQEGVGFACGGGAVREERAFNIANRNRVIKERDLVCVTFCKPKDKAVPFDAYSLIIPEDICEKEEIEPYMLRLKENYIQREHGIALRTTCISRISCVWAETDLFKEHFPGLEMVGFDGDGEIGTNFYPTENEPASPKKPKLSNSFLHFNCTSIVVMTWGKKLT